MNAFSLICIIVCLLMLAGCAQSRQPTVYQGGQYYGNAIHAQDLPGH